MLPPWGDDGQRWQQRFVGSGEKEEEEEEDEEDEEDDEEDDDVDVDVDDACLVVSEPEDDDGY